MSKGLTLIEVLISIALISFIIVSVYSFKIFTSIHIENQIKKNEIKSLITLMYYKAQISMEPNEITNYINNKRSNQTQIMINNTLFKFTKFSQRMISTIDNSQNSYVLIRIEKCEVITQYRNTQKTFVFSIPFIVYKQFPNINYLDPTDPGQPLDNHFYIINSRNF